MWLFQTVSILTRYNLEIHETLNLKYFSELREYWLKRSPTLFQQVKHPNLCATLIQKNDTDRQTLKRQQRFDQLIRRLNDGKHTQSTGHDTTAKEHLRNVKSIQQLTLNNVKIPNENDIIQMPEISAADALAFDVEKLKQSIETGLMAEQQCKDDLQSLGAKRAEAERLLVELAGDKRIKERTQILLENPTVNVEKMGEVLATTESRFVQLAAQWESHRAELIKELEVAENSTSSHTVGIPYSMYILCTFYNLFFLCRLCIDKSLTKRKWQKTKPPKSRRRSALRRSNWLAFAANWSNSTRTSAETTTLRGYSK